jgi:DNA repair protein RecO (recombination protein O)
MKTVSRGIVLKTINHGDTSVISRVFTDTHGIRSFLIKGAKSKRKKGLHLQPLALVEIEYHHHPAKDLLVASSIRCTDPYHHISAELNKSFVFIFLNELIHEALKSDQIDEDLFEFIRTQLLTFDLEDWSPNFHIHFMVQLTKYFGFYPLTGESGRYFNLEDGFFTGTKPACHHLLEGDICEKLYLFCTQSWEKISKLNLTRKERNELTRQMVKYYQLHIHGMKPIKSLDVLTEVLEA